MFFDQAEMLPEPSGSSAALAQVASGNLAGVLGRSSLSPDRFATDYGYRIARG